MPMETGFPHAVPAEFSAAILAGGKGTRLRTVVSDRPKVMAEVHQRPFLTYLLDQLNGAGFRHVILMTGYMAETVEAAIGHQYKSLEVEYSVESEPMGTGGAIRLAEPFARGSQMLIMNGDSYCDVDLQALVRSHGQQGLAGTLTLSHVPDAGRYGAVDLSDGRVTSFREKEPDSGTGWINSGIYLLNRELIRQISTGENVSLERDCLPRWISEGIGGFESAGRFLDIGLPETYAQTEQFFQPAA